MIARENYGSQNIIINITVAAEIDKFQGGKLRKITSIFGKIRNKEVLERVSQVVNHSLASIANGRGSEIDPQKKRTWDLSHKMAATPSTVIGGEVKPRRN